MKIRVEYDSKPIRHIAIQCPDCKKWFYAYDMTNDSLTYEDDIYSARFTCPICDTSHGGYNEMIEIEESGYPDIYKDCLKKKVTWE